MAELNVNEAVAESRETIPRWLRVLLVAAAFIGLWGGLTDLPVLAGNLSEVPGPGFGGAIIIAKIALQPLLALAALVFAVRGRIRPALLAFAAMIFMTWLNFMPSVGIDGFELRGDLLLNSEMLFQIVVAPLIACAVAFLAWKSDRLTLASVLSILPTLANIIGVTAFGISVAIHGF